MMWSPLASWVEIRNAVDWRLRQLFRWSPSAREEPEEGDAETDREARWTQTYGLAPARDKMAAWRWQRNLAVIEILDHVSVDPRFVVVPNPGHPLRVLDIGSKNFDYVDALFGWASSLGATPLITGVELDAHRRYTDLRTRRAWAEHYCASVPGARYCAMGLEDYRDPCDLITWFFPFVTEYPLVRWGLPRSLFRPQALLDHALGLLVPGGWMLIVNLNGAEAAVQHSLLASSGVDFIDLGPVVGSYSAGAGDQRVTLIRRP